MTAPFPPPPGKEATQEERDAWSHQARMHKVASAAAEPQRYKLMHLSALSPTTRRSHAERHGKLYTAEEVIEFWNDPANRVGCKCTVISILVDSKGNPIVEKLVPRAMTTYEKMKKKYGNSWV